MEVRASLLFPSNLFRDENHKTPCSLFLVMLIFVIISLCHMCQNLKKKMMHELHILCNTTKGTVQFQLNYNIT